MTEHDWFRAREPEPLMSDLVRAGMPARQTRLWGCAVARRLAWNHLVDDASCRAIQTAEEFAEGRCQAETLRQVHQEAREVYGDISLAETVVNSGWAASRLAAVLTRPDGEFNHSTVSILARISHAPWSRRSTQPYEWVHRGDLSLRAEADLIQVALVSEIVGENPFRPLILREDVRSWRDGLVVAMAEEILRERTWEHLPVLADALEDAGCESQLLLKHLRGSGPHFVGCWALDLILNRPRLQLKSA